MTFLIFYIGFISLNCTELIIAIIHTIATMQASEFIVITLKV